MSVPSAIRVLSKIDHCVNREGPIDPDVAQKPKDSWVSLRIFLGATEEVLSRLFINDDDPMRIELSDKFMNIILRPQSNAPEYHHFEILTGSNEWFQPNVINETLPDGQLVYATKDLIQLFPKARSEEPTYVLTHGRINEQIMHSTGGKTNPGPLNHIIVSSSLIRELVSFGKGQPHVRALVEPPICHGINPTDDKALSTFRTTIWPAVVKANKFAPTLSVLFKEIITFPNNPLLRTVKGSFRSGVSLDDYRKRLKLPTSPLTRLQNQKFRFSRSESLRRRRLSCVALWVMYFTETSLDGDTLPLRFVYEHPSINELSHALLPS